MDADRVLVPDAPRGERLRWNVIAWRLVGSVIVVFVALVPSAIAVGIHLWNSEGARMHCPSAAELGFPGNQVQVSRGWGEGSYCTVIDREGRYVSSQEQAAPGPLNLFEPRWSFMVVAFGLTVVWGVVLGSLWAIWRTGRARALPRDSGRVLVA